MRVIQAFAQEGASQERFDEVNRANRDAYISAMTLSFVFLPTVEFLGMLRPHRALVRRLAVASDELTLAWWWPFSPMSAAFSADSGTFPALHHHAGPMAEVNVCWSCWTHGQRSKIARCSRHAAIVGQVNCVMSLFRTGAMRACYTTSTC